MKSFVSPIIFFRPFLMLFSGPYSTSASDQTFISNELERLDIVTVISCGAGPVV